MYKKILLSIFLAFAFSICAQAQISTDLVTELLTANGFCHGQAFELRGISRNYPELQNDIKQAESEFDGVFGKSCANIENILRKEIGARLDEIHQRGIAGLVEMRKNNPLSIETSVLFIGSVRKRSKGEIESPYKEILLAYHPDFAADPALEFSNGYVRRYNTGDYPKAKGLDILISIPESWKAREGTGKNIVQAFKNQNGYGKGGLVVQIREIILPQGLTLTQKDIDLLFSPKALKTLIGSDSTLIESKPIVLDGQKGGMLVHDTVEGPSDNKVKLRTISYITIYKNRMIFLQFAIGDTEEKMAETIREFNKNRPLFQLVADSFIIPEKHE